MTFSGISIRVYGIPAPQGSKRHVGNGIMVESSKRVRPWRQDVKHAALEELAGWNDGHGFTGPVAVSVTFYIPRPAYHYGTGRNAHMLRPSAPHYVSKRPDGDKLARALLDGLGEAGTWRDDSQVAHLAATKVYATDSPPGADITIWALDDDRAYLHAVTTTTTKGTTE